jgi:hypothetical protein
MGTYGKNESQRLLQLDGKPEPWRSSRATGEAMATVAAGVSKARRWEVGVVRRRRRSRMG